MAKTHTFLSPAITTDLGEKLDLLDVMFDVAAFS